jgi:predicted nuclease with TOPRIM domain
MEFLAMSPTTWTFLGTIFGGVGLKLVEKWLNRNTEKLNQHKDYRQQINELYERLDKVEAEVDLWREKYYRNEEEITKLRATLIANGFEPPDRTK